MRATLHRLKAAVRILRRGAIAPFDRVPLVDGGGGHPPMGEPFRQSPWVHAAIRHIFRPIVAVNLRFGLRTSKTSEPEVISDPRLDAFWSMPARGMNGLSEFVQASVGWRKLAGECFWILSDGVQVPFPEARASFPQIVFARPDRMRHVPGNDGVAAWEFTDGAGRRHPLHPDQVVHLPQWNPYDSHRGLGEMELAAVAAETDRANGAFARSLARANGDQGPYIIGRSGVVNDEQRKQILAAIRQKRELQSQGIFSAAFLTGDITVEDAKIRSVDAAFLEQRRSSAEEIFVAFGVPPSMARTMGSYSIGSASDYYRLILDTCVPEAAAIAEGIAKVSSLLLGRQVWAWFDWDDHPVYQEVRRERINMASALWDKGMPMSEVSQYLDLGLPRFRGDSQGYLPAGMVPSTQNPSSASAAAPRHHR